MISVMTSWSEYRPSFKKPTMLDFKKDIQPYLIKYGDKLPKNTALLHKYYDRSVKHKRLIGSVFGDEYPDFLQVDRPKEREKKSHANFRKAIYKAVTKPFRRRVINALTSIRDADDFSVDFPAHDEKLKLEDTLRYYTTENFGNWKSVDQWFWEEGVQRYIDDPNACAVLVPIIPDDPTKYREVKPLWAGSEQIWYYGEGQKAVICSETKSMITVNGKAKKDGTILYFFDSESFCTAQMVSHSGSKTSWEITGLQAVETESGEIGFVEDFPKHNFRRMPVFKVGQLTTETSEDGTFVLYESLVNDSIPALKSVLQRASDIDIEALLHTGSLEWQYVSKKCHACNGKGAILTDSELPKGRAKRTEKKCGECKGSGFEIFDSALEKILISAPNQTQFDDQKVVNMPTPPAGMVERSPAAIKELREEYQRNMLEAYQGVGLGHIANQMFMSTSGTSKRYDREEGEKLIINNCRHFVDRLILPIYAGIDAIRYGVYRDQYVSQIPAIKSPKRFDVATIDMTRLELNDAMSNDYSEELKDALQLKYLEQTVGKDSLRYKTYRVKMLLDPHRNKTDEMKSFLISQALVTMDRDSEPFKLLLAEYQFSLNFETILRNATLAASDFFSMTLNEQYELLKTENQKYVSIRPAGQPIEMATLAPLINSKDVSQLE